MLINLFNDFDFAWSRSVRSTVLQPFLIPFQRVKNGETPTEKGLSYLEVKYHLLLQYCTHLSYYALLKVIQTVHMDKIVLRANNYVG